MILRKVTITTELTTSVTKWVPAHEIPVLRAIHGDGPVQPRSGIRIVRRPRCTAASECERLTHAYSEQAVKEAYGAAYDQFYAQWNRAWGARLVLALLAPFAPKERAPRPCGRVVKAYAVTDTVALRAAIDEGLKDYEVVRSMAESKVEAAS